MYDTIQSLLNFSKQLQIDSTTAVLEVELIISYVLKVNRAYLRAYPEHKITASQAATISTYLQRRQQGEPIAYILGHKEFWKLNFKVTPATLIPRPETELLIELALQKLPLQKKIKIADLGTGSGAIALSLAYECPLWQIYATDLSKSALAVARENAAQFNINNVTFLQGTWCSALPSEKFAAIISNPPYIAENDFHLQQGDLRFEPKSALKSGINGLDDIYLILQQAKDYLLPDGLIFLEHGYKQAVAVRDLMTQSGYVEIETHTDLQGHQRVTIGLSKI